MSAGNNKEQIEDIDISPVQLRREKLKNETRTEEEIRERSEYAGDVFGSIAWYWVPLSGLIGCGIFAYFNNGHYTNLVWKISLLAGLVFALLRSEKITRQAFGEEPATPSLLDRLHITDRTKAIMNVVGLSLYWEFYLLWIVVAVPRKIHRLFSHSFDLWQLNMVIELGLFLPVILVVCTQAYLKKKSARLIRIPLLVLVMMPVLESVLYSTAMMIAGR